MKELNDAIDDAAAKTFDQLRRDFEAGIVPVDVGGADPAFLRELVEMNVDPDEIDEWSEWDEVVPLIDRRIADARSNY